MAQKAKKDRARSNIAALKNLHIGTLSLNIIFLLFNFLIRSRNLIPYILLTIPALIVQYVLETTGRPKYDANGALKSAGEDLAAPGLTEYFFDIVWVHWLALVSVILFGNWGWIVWALIPGFAVFKGAGLFGAAKGMLGARQGEQVQEEQAPAAGNRKQRRAA